MAAPAPISTNPSNQPIETVRPASPVDNYENEKKTAETDVDIADVDRTQMTDAERSGGVNLKKIIRKVDYRLLPGLGLL